LHLFTLSLERADCFCGPLRFDGSEGIVCRFDAETANASARKIDSLMRLSRSAPANSQRKADPVAGLAMAIGAVAR